VKTTIGSGRTRSAPALMLVSLVTTVLPFGTAPFGAQPIAHAQASPDSTDVRLRRIEAELRAVQRKVFPDGAGKTLGPEIVPVSGDGSDRSHAPRRLQTSLPAWMLSKCSCSG